MSKRQRRAAFIASTATPVECPTKYGETRSLKSTHGSKGRVDRLAFQERVRPRFAGQRFVPRRSRVDGNEPGRVISEGRDHVGIERVPRTTADHRRRMVGTTEHPLEGGVSGDVNDPHRQRYLVASRTTWLTLAVPTLGDVARTGRPPTDGRRAGR